MMTEAQYRRLRVRIGHLLGNRIGTPCRLSEARFQRIWSEISEGATPPKDFKHFMATASDVKKRLLSYVLKNGPFVFEDGRCLFVDVAAFELDDWQWPNIPVLDVTDVAQKAFRTEFELDPKEYLSERKGLLAKIASAMLILAYLIQK